MGPLMCTPRIILPVQLERRINERRMERALKTPAAASPSERSQHVLQCFFYLYYDHKHSPFLPRFTTSILLSFNCTSEACTLTNGLFGYIFFQRGEAMGALKSAVRVLLGTHLLSSLMPLGQSAQSEAAVAAHQPPARPLPPLTGTAHAHAATASPLTPIRQQSPTVLLSCKNGI